MRLVTSLLLVLATLFWSEAVLAQTLHVGVATGFPPYQYTVDGRPTGLDVELAEVVAKEAGLSLVWTQGPWDDLTAVLRLTADLDFLTGMEKTGDRTSLFLLGKTLLSGSLKNEKFNRSTKSPVDLVSTRT